MVMLQPYSGRTKLYLVNYTHRILSIREESSTGNYTVVEEWKCGSGGDGASTAVCFGGRPDHFKEHIYVFINMIKVHLLMFRPFQRK